MEIANKFAEPLSVGNITYNITKDFTLEFAETVERQSKKFLGALTSKLILDADELFSKGIHGNTLEEFSAKATILFVLIERMTN